jgi:hypothetical protein
MMMMMKSQKHIFNSKVAKLWLHILCIWSQTLYTFAPSVNALEKYWERSVQHLQPPSVALPRAFVSHKFAIIYLTSLVIWPNFMKISNFVWMFFNCKKTLKSSPNLCNAYKTHNHSSSSTYSRCRCTCTLQRCGWDRKHVALAETTGHAPPAPHMLHLWKESRAIILKWCSYLLV